MSSSEARRAYSHGEEVANSITHGLGVLFSIVGLVLLVAIAARNHDIWQVVSSAIYGSTLLLLYTASTLYHSIPLPVPKRILQTLDHIAIFLLIAGTYTPFSLISLRDSWGWPLFCSVWGLALLGVLIELSFLKRYHAMQVGLYIAMGWIALIAIKPLMAAVPYDGLVLLFAGGIAYTFGVIFYVWRSMRYHHALWHLFVLAGSVLHYFAVLFYVLPRS